MLMLVDYIKLIGLAGSIFLCMCGVPQAWRSFKDKNSDGLALGFVILWLLGEVFMLTYVIIVHGKDISLLINYIFSAFTISIISYFKFFPVRKRPIKFIKEEIIWLEQPSYITYMELSEEEHTKYLKFKEEHNKCNSKILHRFSFSSGIGRNFCVKCGICGKEEDLTNYGVW